jgi:hypothetical protein
LAAFFSIKRGVLPLSIDRLNLHRYADGLGTVSRDRLLAPNANFVRNCPTIARQPTVE